MPGFLAVLTAKLAGLGTVAKAAIAAVTAALTMTVAGGATGVLPLPGGRADSEAAAQSAVSRSAVAVTGAAGAAPAGAAPERAGVAASATSTAGTASTRAAAELPKPVPSSIVAVQKAVTSSSLPPTTKVPRPTLPALGALPPCVARLIPTAGTRPDPVKLTAELPECLLSVITARLPLDTIEGALGSSKLPVDVVKCLSTTLRSAATSVGGNPSAVLSGLPRLLSACLPKGSIPGLGPISGATSGRR